MDEAKKQEMESKWKLVATQAVTSDEYKKKLFRNPLEVMKESGLEPPAGAKVNKSVDNEIRLILPEDASDELKVEVTWWDWRFKTIREFGKEIETGTQEVMPESEEGV